jgi:sulfur transfer complex TusBCD TusB component (DsrH family)
MVKKFKAIKISPQGFLTNERDEPLVCPIRGTSCNFKCAWLTADDNIFYCQNTVIGALRGKPMRSFHLHTGPEVYNLDESLKNYG